MSYTIIKGLAYIITLQYIYTIYPGWFYATLLGGLVKHMNVFSIIRFFYIGIGNFFIFKLDI